MRTDMGRILNSLYVTYVRKLRKSLYLRNKHAHLLPPNCSPYADVSPNGQPTEVRSVEHKGSHDEPAVPGRRRDALAWPDLLL